MPPEDPDLVLVEAAQKGDDGAFDALLKRHQERIYHFILRHVTNEADATDLAQETFVKAYFNISKFTPRGLFTTWLCQIALNLCRDLVKSKAWKNRQQTDSLFFESDSTNCDVRKDIQSGPSSDPIRDEETQMLLQAIEELPIELKGPLMLTTIDGLSHAEAGIRLGISAKAVESKVYRARKLLLQKFKR
ncbi:hypothetical protein DB346_23365 [Verrucomicrobia bacterium LW23]|nr:hypothetical protein DB346_23365 [Verrucomicrobia bacterium LW23]